MNSILQVERLQIYFKTQTGLIEAVKDIHFNLQKGEIVGLVGESGSGKSVTAQSILRLIPQEGTQQSGQILFEGENLLNKTEKEMEAIRGKKISLIFQDPMTSLNPTMRIGQQVAEGLMKHEHLTTLEAYERGLDLLHQVGLTDVKERFYQFPHELSGGMRQRILIAIAIACSPSLIIADEPTTGLDVTIQAQILDLLKEIQQRSQTTILFITHDLGVVARLCDRVLVMYGGRIVESGCVESIFSNAAHPYTQGLLKSRRSLSCLHEPLFAIPGAPPSLLAPPSSCLFAPRCPHAMPICSQEIPRLQRLSLTHESACWLTHSKEKL